MQSAPSNYDAIYAEGDYSVEYKVNIDGTDYYQRSDVVDGYTKQSSYIWSLKTSRKVFSENNPMIGCAMVGQIDLTIMSPGVTFSRRASIKPYIRIRSRNNTNRVSGWLQKGEFFIDTRPEDDTDDIDIIEIQGFDAMRKANQKYPSSTLSWTATRPWAYEVVREIAGFIGVSVDTDTNTLLYNTRDANHVIAFPAQYTMAEVLGSIGAMYGGNFIISDIGRLKLVSLMDLPAETYYLVNEKGNYITFGGTRILLRGG